MQRDSRPGRASLGSLGDIDPGCALTQILVGGITGGTGAWVATKLAQGGYTLTQVVAISCVYGAVEGGGATAVTSYANPNEDVTLNSTLINAALGCALSSVMGGRAHQRTIVLADDLSADIIQRADAHLTGNGETVLGRYKDGYITAAQERGSSYFDIGDAWDTLTDAQRWAANKRLLDTGVRNGDTFYFVTKRDDIPWGLGTWKEVVYLEHFGYEWVTDTLMEKVT